MDHKINRRFLQLFGALINLYEQPYSHKQTLSAADLAQLLGFNSEHTAVKYLYNLYPKHSHRNHAQSLIQIHKKIGPYSLRDNIAIIRATPDPEAYLFQSDELLINGHILTAIDLIKQAKEFTKNRQILIKLEAQLANLYLELGDIPKSQRYANNTLALIGKHKNNVLRSYMHLIIARGYMQLYDMNAKNRTLGLSMHNLRTAMTLWDTYHLRKDTRNTELIACQALILSKMGDVQGAKKAFKKAEAIVKDDEYLLLALRYYKSISYIGLTELEAAAQELHTIKSLNHHSNLVYTRTQLLDILHAEALLYQTNGAIIQYNQAIRQAHLLALQCRLKGPQWEKINTAFLALTGADRQFTAEDQDRIALNNANMDVYYPKCPLCYAITNNPRGNS